MVFIAHRERKYINILLIRFDNKRVLIVNYLQKNLHIIAGCQWRNLNKKVAYVSLIS